MDDIYRPPAADLETGEQQGKPCYVVSRAKFLTLYLSTMGLYGIYWFYRQWRDYKLYTGRSLWPVPRAIFSIFFAHALFNRFYEAARSADPQLQWRPWLYATLYVVFYLISGMSDMLVVTGMSILATRGIYFAAFFALAWTLSRAQGVANLASGDPAGKRNSRLGVANIAWIILGLVLWLGLLADIAVTLGWLSALNEQGA